MGHRSPSRARATVFAPLEAAGRVELVSRRLTDAIALGLLRDGEQLPSEAELAASLGVATVTVREALSALRQQGLVETRRGRGGGSFVRSPDDPAAALLRSRLEELSLSELRDLCDHYAAIAGAAARLAADRAAEDEIDRLRAAAEAMDRAVDAGQRRRAEGTFHIEVVAAAQSARLTREEIRLQNEVGPLLWLASGDGTVGKAAFTQHLEVTRLIGDGDGDGARAATEEHVGAALTRLTALHRSLSRARRSGGTGR
ncbi:MAG: FadR/GntR family transcriptional regulator [Motilibacteraceae bacterium]